MLGRCLRNTGIHSYEFPARRIPIHGRLRSVMITTWLNTIAIRQLSARSGSASHQLDRRGTSSVVTSPVNQVHSPVFDFSSTPVAEEYTGFYVKVIDDVFTPKECADFIALAESDQEWKQAAIHLGLLPDQNRVDVDYRNSLRILRYDSEAAERIYQRLLPYVHELVTIGPGNEWDGVMGTKGHLKRIWDLVGVNERLSFLKYEQGNYFKPHCDNLQRLPDGRRARATLQIYLGEDGAEGGATRIIGARGNYVDIEPKRGRVLIFQHRKLLHGGESVTEGIKYMLRSDFMFRLRDPVEQ